MKSENKIASFFNALFVKNRNFGFVEKIENTITKMNPTEKLFFYFFCSVFVISSLILAFRVNNIFLVEVPKFGGSFSEGIIGSPRFINPILAISDTDKDISTLVYSGLLKADKENGFVNDLAESYKISDDGTTYDFKLKEAYFHDGKKVTSDDVIFTIQKILDPVIKSPKRSNWEGVMIEKISENEIRFVLNKAYSPFLQNLTLGILPKHIWENVSSEEFPFSQFNINPIGSGPYKVDKISRNSGGIPTSIVFAPWKKYHLEKPIIKKITLKFFSNQNDLMKAYENKDVEGISVLSPSITKEIKNQNNLYTFSLPRVFGIFFNQNNATVLVNKEVRKALELATPKADILENVLFGYGKILNGPTPEYTEEDVLSAKGNIEEAIKILSDAGWVKNENGILEKKTKSGKEILSFSISTSDSEDLKKVAEIIRDSWAKIGAIVEIKVFESSDLSQNIIKGRKFDALLFGEVVDNNSDLYPFWHSSARNDLGLNIALYANIKVDKALEEIQRSSDEKENRERKEIIRSEIKEDIPAIFLFSPSATYLPSNKIKNITLKNISAQNERFSFINEWYIETEKVWSFFVN